MIAARHNGRTIGRRFTFGDSGERRIDWSRQDAGRGYVSDSPTVTKFVGLVRNADDGDVGALMELGEEIIAKDAHWQGVVNTRLNAVTALEWEIVADTSVESQQMLADRSAEIVEAELRQCPTFEDTLRHLAEAVIPNMAVTELVWQLDDANSPALIATNDVPGHRLVSVPSDGPNIRIRTDDNLNPGITTPPGKFIVYTPNAQAGFPLRVSILRAQIWMYLVKHFVTADWAAFAEVFGAPHRMAVADENVINEVRTEVEKALQNLSADGYGIMPKGVDFKYLEASRGTQPYEALLDRIDKKQSILVLGQTLTTDTGGVGSLALGKVHDSVRTDILVSDLRNEAAMLRKQLIAPIVALRMPGRDVPLPHFRRKVIEEKNLDAARLDLDKLRLATELGLPVDDDVKYELLGIAKPVEEEAMQ